MLCVAALVLAIPFFLTIFIQLVPSSWLRARPTGKSRGVDVAIVLGFGYIVTVWLMTRRRPITLNTACMQASISSTFTPSRGTTVTRPIPCGQPFLKQPWAIFTTGTSLPGMNRRAIQRFYSSCTISFNPTNHTPSPSAWAVSCSVKPPREKRA